MNNDLISRYFDEVPKLEASIHQYFGYQDRWRGAPLEDLRQYHWIIDGNSVYFSKNKITDLEDGDLYSNNILPDQQGKPTILRAKDYTAILADTQTDGNIFLSIFDNSKELKEHDLGTDSRSS